MKDLIVRISGEVTESNFSIFKDDALAMIKAADVPLITDNDFSNAEKTVKNCQSAENAIKVAKEEALKETADISKLFESLDEVSSALRTTRLSLSKKVKTEKDNRKSQVVDAGYEKLEKAIDKVAEKIPEIHNAITVRRSIFEDAVKGKQKIESMEDAVEAVLEFKNEELERLEKLISENKKQVEACELQTLFPDADTLVCLPFGEVKSTIAGRVAKHELEERDRKDREAKAEEDRKAREYAKQEAIVKEDVVNVEPVEEYSKGVSEQTVQPEQLSVEPEEHEPEAQQESFIIYVELLCSVDNAKKVAGYVNSAIGKEPEIVKIKLERGS